MKLPEPVAWMLDGKPYIAQQCRFFSKSPGEVIPGQVPLFTEDQLREALAQQAEELKQMQEQNTALDAKLAQQEAVMRQALEAFQTTNLDMHVAAITALEEALGSSA